MLAASAARRWLARNAAGVRLLRVSYGAEASKCTSLVSCMPALQDISLCLIPPLTRNELGCLLEALAWCPRLRTLRLFIAAFGRSEGDEALHGSFLDASFAKLSSLTKLVLNFDMLFGYSLADVVGALVSLTSLAELSIGLMRSAVVPAALGQLKGLRSLDFLFLSPCALEPGCLELPDLRSLTFLN